LKKLHVTLLLIVLLGVNCIFGYCDGNDIMAGGRLVRKRVVSIVPIEFDGLNMLIKVKINKAGEYTFLLDTGSSGVIVDKNVAEKFNEGKRFDAKIGDGLTTRNGELIQLKSVKVGNIEIQNCGAYVFDLSQLNSCGRKVDGILGDNFLKFLLVKIDYDKKLLTLSGNTDNNENLRGYNFKLLRSDGHIFAEFSTGSITSLMAAIDTGGAIDEYVAFPSKFLDMVKPELNCQLIKTVGAGALALFGQTDAIDSRLSAMELGNFKFTNIPVRFEDQRYISITNSFLEHFIVLSIILNLK
jgi:hypothetical protein